jgi:hypothetical protein
MLGDLPRRHRAIRLNEYLDPLALGLALQVRDTQPLRITSDIQGMQSRIERRTQ